MGAVARWGGAETRWEHWHGGGRQRHDRSSGTVGGGRDTVGAVARWGAAETRWEQ